MPKFCRNCGVKVSPGARFCKNCGLKFDLPDPPDLPDQGTPLGRDDLPERPAPRVRTAKPAVRPPQRPAPARKRASPAKQGRSPVLLLFIGGFGLLLCCGIVAGAFLLLKNMPGGPEIGIPQNPPVIISENEEAGEPDYELRRLAPTETASETVTGMTSGGPTVLSLSDGTRVRLPASASPVPVALTKESSTIQLEDRPDLQVSGSQRVLEVDLSQVGENFVPVLTIPAQELGDLDPATVNIARVGDVLVDGELQKDRVIFLPFTLDEDGNLVVVDGITTALSTPEIGSRGSNTVRMAAFRSRAAQVSRTRYILMTFQSHLEWQIAPRLVRMIPDASQPGLRRPADLKQDKELLQKPVVNVIVLVHGHNEEEKDGSTPPSAEDPWMVEYKKDVWIELYKSFLAEKKDQVDCTAFYEFIYPTYRPAYSPLEGSPVEPLGTTLAKALKVGARNDGYFIKKMAAAKIPVNLFITAHSMGGLVSREAIRQLDGWPEENFQQLVTWGTPHHGSPLITLGYLLHGPYQAVGGGAMVSVFNSFLGGENLNWALDRFMQLDTPGERDLRWDNIQPLRLDELFTINPEAIPPGKTAEYYDLNRGGWLYNDNLRQLNQSDPYQNGEKYYFLYGVTSKRFNEPYLFTQTALGATLIEKLLRDPEAAVPGLGGRASDSDGAVPLASMAGLNIANFRTDNLGDVDHEEYYSHASDLLYGGKVARRTFERLGLPAPRCSCATLEVESLGDLKSIAPDTDLDINALFSLDPELDSSPGKRIQAAEALFYIAGTKEEFSLGDLQVEEDGKLSSSFSMPDLGAGEHQFVVRAHFTDGTLLESSPRSKAIYTGIYVMASPVADGLCYQGDQFFTSSFNYLERGMISEWTGDGAFTVDRILPNDFIQIVQEKLSGKVSPDGKSISLQFEFAYHDAYESSGSTTTQDITGSGSLIDIPFVEHVIRGDAEYDRFVIEGGLDILRPHMQFWRQEVITTNQEQQTDLDTFDAITSCDGPGRIEVWMYISGLNLAP